jgi:hypothetical protein
LPGGVFRRPTSAADGVVGVCTVLIVGQNAYMQKTCLQRMSRCAMKGMIFTVGLPTVLVDSIVAPNRWPAPRTAGPGQSRPTTPCSARRPSLAYLTLPPPARPSARHGRPGSAGRRPAGQVGRPGGPAALRRTRRPSMPGRPHCAKRAGPAGPVRTPPSNHPARPQTLQHVGTTSHCVNAVFATD